MLQRLAVVLLFGLSSCTCSNSSHPPPPPCAGKDLQTDALNCGACANACARGVACQAGRCVDPCAGKDLATDAQNCGTCGHACATGNSCQAGGCVDPCADKDFVHDPQNCGACANACPAGDTCQASLCVEPLAVAFASPGDGAHSLPKIHASLQLSFSGAVDSLTVSLTGLPAQTLTAAPSVAAILDGSSLADGPVVATATLTKGGRTATATRIFVIDRAPLVPSISIGGFYEETALLPLRATFAASGKPVSVVVTSDAQVAPVATLSASGAAWTAPPFQAIAAGPGPRALTFTATDAEGNSASATATLSIGLLPGSGSFRAVYDVKNASARGILYAGAVVSAGASAAGELRYLPVNGGVAVTFAPQACFSLYSGYGGLDAVVSADGTRVLFSGPSSATATDCARLYSSAIPPGAADPVLLSTSLPAPDLHSTHAALLSLDGAVALWVESDAQGVITWHSTTLTGTPAPALVATGPTALTSPSLYGFPLSGAVLAFNPGTLVGNTTSALLVNASGSATVTAGGSPAVLSVSNAAAANSVEPPRDGRDWTVATDGSGILVDSQLGFLAIRSSSALATVVCPVNQCHDALSLPGGRGLLTNVTSTAPFASSVELVSMGSGTVVELANLTAGVSATSSWDRMKPPSRGAWAPVQTTAGLAQALSLDGVLTALSTAPLSGDASLGALGEPGSYADPLDAWDDPAQAIATDASGTFVTRLGSAPVQIDSSTDLAADVRILRDRTHLVFVNPTQTKIFAYAFGAAQSVELATAANADPISMSAEARGSRFVPFVRTATSTTTGRLFAGAVDGSGTRQLTKLDDSDAVDMNNGVFGSSTDDSSIYWVAVDGHLYAQPPAGGATVDFGALANPSYTLTPLTAGTFVFLVAGATPQLAWATLASPVPHLLGGSTTSKSLVSGDFSTLLLSTATSTVRIAQGAITTLAPATTRYFPSTRGLRSTSFFTNDGALFYASTDKGALAPLALEPPGTMGNILAPQAANPVPNESGLLLGPSFSTGRHLQGAQQRTTLLYQNHDPVRGGLYVIETVDSIYEPPAN